MSITKLHASMTKISLAILTAVSSLSLSSCQDEDYGFTSDEVRSAVYDRNFIKFFGKIDPEQNWDLTSMNYSGHPFTRAGEGISVSQMSNWYDVDYDLVQQFNDKLPEGDGNNSKNGVTGFHLFSNGTFYIVPVYQGQSGVNTKLMMTLSYNNTEYGPYEIWSRDGYNEDGVRKTTIQRQNEGSLEWKDLQNGREWFKTIDYYNDTKVGKYLASTRAAVGIRSKPIKCVVPYGAEAKFYLEVINGHMNYRSCDADFDRISAGHSESNLARKGDIMMASAGKMIKITEGFTLPDLSMFGEKPTAFFIACEDAWAKDDFKSSITYTSTRESDWMQNDWLNEKVVDNGVAENPGEHNLHNYSITVNPEDWAGDNDMNDLVFMFVSDNPPTSTDASTVAKRYLVEDLGSIVDWDFNDIVVDMEQTTIPATPDDPSSESVTQTATLKHLCGTTPFEVFVGELSNRENSVKLDFRGEGITILEKQDGSQTVSAIDGRVMDKEDELNLTFTLPNNSPVKWNPDLNNIWVRVYQEVEYPKGYVDPSYGGGAGPHSSTTHQGVIDGVVTAWFDYGAFVDVAFPATGKVPRIIAVETDHMWTEENENIEKADWYVYKIETSIEGYGDVTGSGVYKAGSEFTLMASPKDGNRFVGWYQNGELKSSSASYSGTYGVSESPIVFTAKFEAWKNNESVNPNGSYGEALWATTMLNDWKEKIEAGYNTIVVETTSESSGKFGLRSTTESGKDYIVEGDAVDYPFSASNPGEVVLTPAQIAFLKEEGSNLYVCQRSTNVPITNVFLKKTESFYTVGLKPIDPLDGVNPGSVKVYVGGNEERSTYDGRNGNNPFLEASYPTSTPIQLRPSPNSDDYAFAYWEQYAGDKKINTIREQNLTVSSNTTLKAVFKKKGQLSYKVENGETVTIQYSTDDGTTYSTLSVEGVKFDEDKNLLIKVTSVTAPNGVNVDGKPSNIDLTKCVLDISGGDKSYKDQIQGGDPMAFSFSADNGLSLNIAVRYLVKGDRWIKNGTSETLSNGVSNLAISLRIKGSDIVESDHLYAPWGSTVELTAKAVDNNLHSFLRWSSGDTGLSRDLVISGNNTVPPYIPAAYFETLPASVFWNSDAGKTLKNGEGITEMAYGSASDFVGKINSSTNKTITITFAETVTGNVKLFTAYAYNSEGGKDNSWSALNQSNPQETIRINGSNTLTITLNSDQINRIADLNGLVIQNLTRNEFTVKRITIN